MFLMKGNRTRDETNYGVPRRSLKGHSHIVSDCVKSPGALRPPHPPHPPHSGPPFPVIRLAIDIERLTEL